MVAVPPATPVTTPPELTDAVPAALLVHVPPGVALVSVVVAPWHTLTGVAGPIAAGAEFTVTIRVDVHPPVVYEMTAVPADTLLTTPAATVATPGDPLAHTPPAGVADSVVLLPRHIDAVPVMAAAGAVMVIVCVDDV